MENGKTLRGASEHAQPREDAPEKKFSRFRILLERLADAGREALAVLSPRTVKATGAALVFSFSLSCGQANDEPEDIEEDRPDAAEVDSPEADGGVEEFAPEDTGVEDAMAGEDAEDPDDWDAEATDAPDVDAESDYEIVDSETDAEAPVDADKEDAEPEDAAVEDAPPEEEAEDSGEDEDSEVPGPCELYPEGHVNRATFGLNDARFPEGSVSSLTFKEMTETESRFIVLPSFEFVAFEAGVPQVIAMGGAGSVTFEECDRTPLPCSARASPYTGDVDCTVTLAADRPWR